MAPGNLVWDEAGPARQSLWALLARPPRLRDFQALRWLDLLVTAPALLARPPPRVSWVASTLPGRRMTAGPDRRTPRATRACPPPSPPPPPPPLPSCLRPGWQPSPSMAPIRIQLLSMTFQETLQRFCGTAIKFTASGKRLNCATRCGIAACQSLGFDIHAHESPSYRCSIVYHCWVWHCQRVG